MLDTHVLLWTLADSDRLGRKARSLIENRENTILASAISIWEVAIKWSLRRGTDSDMPLSGREFHQALVRAGIETIDSTPQHAIALDDLPLIHGDPFDRLLLATAKVEGLRLLTSGKLLARYGEPVLLV